MRLRLEMNWEVQEIKESQECVVEDPSTCGGEICPECEGQGTLPCRFCRGTTQLYMGPQVGFKSCQICEAGHEECPKCRGTGWIAHWTTLHPDEPSEECRDGEECSTSGFL
jgi:hypothetical protein